MVSAEEEKERLHSIVVITQHCIYTNLQLGYYIVLLLCVGCV